MAIYQHFFFLTIYPRLLSFASLTLELFLGSDCAIIGIIAHMRRAGVLGIGLTAWIAGGLSSAITFIILASAWAIAADPSGSGSGYAIFGFMFFSPVVAGVAGVLIAIVVLITARLLPASIRPNFEAPLTTWQTALWAGVSMLIGVVLVIIAIVLFVRTG